MCSSARRVAVRLEVLPDLLDDARFDDDGVAFLRLLLRVERELDRSALRPERAGVEDVETLIDRGVADAVFELERMDRRHLGVAAEGAHARERRLRTLDRRDRNALCLRGAARDGRPEAFHRLRSDANQHYGWKVLDIIGPVAEVHERPHYS